MPLTPPLKRGPRSPKLWRRCPNQTRRFGMQTCLSSCRPAGRASTAASVEGSEVRPEALGLCPGADFKQENWKTKSAKLAGQTKDATVSGAVGAKNLTMKAGKCAATVAHACSCS